MKNLEIYEIDLQSMRVHFRWQKPEPPVNGEIKYYMVKSCFSSCEFISKIRPTEYCQLWDKYICANVEHPAKEIKVPNAPFIDQRDTVLSLKNTYEYFSDIS